MQSLDAIILAGGLGTRLRSVVPDLPKPMAPVNGKPFLDLLMYKLGRSGIIRSVMLSLCYRSDNVVAWYEENRRFFPFLIRYSIEEEALGTGGAIRCALDLLSGDTVLAMNGDSFVDVDFKKLLEFHNDNYSDFTIVVKYLEDTSRYGSVDIDLNNSRLKGFREKSGSNAGGYINAGVYMFNRAIWMDVESGSKFSIEHDFLPGLIDKNCFCYTTDKDFIDIGTPETYKTASDFMKGKK